jgi:hypothetical protein
MQCDEFSSLTPPDVFPNADNLFGAGMQSLNHLR